ncbi:unnamed protein product [Heligmosomoides polygyrus]|uniref:DUF3336 domain-containing protein n=1 Tax=Heligmosomoides polygyrus TaxID=6339 RepID=A0A183FYN6_HELPZ|nr:unnamed protein product [Heligmosomoides polygyrus]
MTSPQELSKEALLRSPRQTSDGREMETEYQAHDMSQTELRHKQLQLSELADRIKQMGTNVPAHGNFNGVNLSRLEEWDGHLLLAVAHAKLLAEKGAGASYVGHRARERESFKRFINSFLVKYPKRLWDDKSLIQLLEIMLRKDALTIFETLPHSVKAGTFDDVVRAMQDRLKDDDNNAWVKAMTTLRKLAIRDGQSVSEFCLVLEKMANKAFLDSPPECTSLQKAETLFNQLAHWEGSYVLSEALERADRKEGKGSGPKVGKN